MNEIKESVNALYDDKQDTLESGTNIKTINGDSILGSGNLEVSSLNMANTNLQLDDNRTHDLNSYSLVFDFYDGAGTGRSLSIGSSSVVYNAADPTQGFNFVLSETGINSSGGGVSSSYNIIANTSTLDINHTDSGNSAGVSIQGGKFIISGNHELDNIYTPTVNPGLNKFQPYVDPSGVFQVVYTDQLGSTQSAIVGVNVSNSDLISDGNYTWDLNGNDLNFVNGTDNIFHSSDTDKNLLIGLESKSNGSPTNNFGVGIGQEAEIGAQSVSVGYLAVSTTSSVAIGYASSTSNNDGISIGHGSSVNDFEGIAIGADSIAEDRRTIAIGFKTEGYGNDSVFIGPLMMTDTVATPINNFFAIGAISTGEMTQGVHGVSGDRFYDVSVANPQVGVHFESVANTGANSSNKTYHNVGQNPTNTNPISSVRQYVKYNTMKQVTSTVGTATISGLYGIDLPAGSDKSNLSVGKTLKFKGNVNFIPYYMKIISIVGDTLTMDRRFPNTSGSTTFDVNGDTDLTSHYIRVVEDMDIVFEDDKGLKTDGLINFNDNLGLLAEITMSTSQAALSTVPTKVAFDTETSDKHDDFDTSLNRYVVSEKTGKGTYLPIVTLEVTTGLRGPVEVQLYKNGSPVPQSCMNTEVYDQAETACINALRPIDLDIGDYIEIWTLQNTGATATIQTSTTNLTISKIG